MDFIDLDIIKPKLRAIKIDGKTLDISFIPLAITAAVDSIMNKLKAFSPSDLDSDPEKGKEATDLSIQLCALFCEHKYPELNEDWFRHNADAFQVKILTEEIGKTLISSYSGIDRYMSKNEVGASLVS